MLVFLDSGASYTIVPLKLLKSSGLLQIRLTPCDVRLRGFSGKEITVHGSFRTEIGFQREREYLC